MVSPADVRASRDFNGLICPAPAEALSERKRQFSELSSPRRFAFRVAPLHAPLAEEELRADQVEVLRLRCHSRAKQTLWAPPPLQAVAPNDMPRLASGSTASIARPAPRPTWLSRERRLCRLAARFRLAAASRPVGAQSPSFPRPAVLRARGRLAPSALSEFALMWVSTF